jgi:hypothetical protein
MARGDGESLPVALAVSSAFAGWTHHRKTCGCNFSRALIIELCERRSTPEGGDERSRLGRHRRCWR